MASHSQLQRARPGTATSCSHQPQPLAACVWQGPPYYQDSVEVEGGRLVQLHTSAQSSPQILTASGYRARAYRCPALEEACPGPERDDDGQITGPANQCAAGYTGVACALCEEGYSLSLGTGFCVECSDNDGENMAFLLSLVCVGMIVAVYWFAARPLMMKRNSQFQAWFVASRIGPLFERIRAFKEALQSMKEASVKLKSRQTCS